jgi:adenylosuccinate lyase
LQLYQRKLPISRLQRDLSDSTVLRTLGTTFGHSLLAYSSLLKGLSQLTVNQANVEHDLNDNYAILSEAWQMVSRTQGDVQAYEAVASRAKQAIWNQADWQKMVGEQGSGLKQLTPASYIGVSTKLVQQQCEELDQYVASRRAELARKSQ